MRDRPKLRHLCGPGSAAHHFVLRYARDTRACRLNQYSTKVGTKCGRFEVPTAVAANSVRNFKSKSGTRIIELLVPLCFRSSCRMVLRCITNFGSGALAHVPEKACPGLDHKRITRVFRRAMGGHRFSGKDRSA